MKLHYVSTLLLVGFFFVVTDEVVAQSAGMTARFNTAAAMRNQAALSRMNMARINNASKSMANLAQKADKLALSLKRGLISPNPVLRPSGPKLPGAKSVNSEVHRAALARTDKISRALALKSVTALSSKHPVYPTVKLSTLTSKGSDSGTKQGLTFIERLKGAGKNNFSASSIGGKLKADFFKSNELPR